MIEFIEVTYYTILIFDLRLFHPMGGILLYILYLSGLEWLILSLKWWFNLLEYTHTN